MWKESCGHKERNGALFQTKTSAKNSNLSSRAAFLSPRLEHRHISWDHFRLWDGTCFWLNPKKTRTEILTFVIRALLRGCVEAERVNASAPKKNKKTKRHMHYLLPACVPLLFTAQTKLKAHVRELNLLRKRPLLSPYFFLTPFLMQVSPLCHHLASATGQLFWVMQVQFLWLKEQNLPKLFVKLCINITCQITN